MTDFIDKLTHSEPEDVQQVGTVNALGVRKVNMMAVPERAVSAEDIEAREQAFLDAPQFPIPFWDLDDGPALEPLITQDHALLRAAGITAEEWEQIVLEDQLEKSK